MKFKARFALPAAVAAAFIGLSVAPVPAEAGGYAVPQAPCDKVGEQREARNGETYECRLKPGADCPRWSWVFNHHAPKGGWTPRPGAPCVKCSPSAGASVSPSVTAPVSTSPQPSRSANVTPSRPATGHNTPAVVTTTPGGEDYNNHPGTLPVTGPRAALLAIAGTAIVMLGGGALWFGRKPRRQRKPYPPR